jgi:putative integral membrane protein (TIGR02587 family)
MTADVAMSTHSVRDTAAAYARGIAGGLLVGMPTLMTMEMWWGGFVIPSVRILLLVAVNFGVLLVLQHFSGLHPRKTPAAQLRAAIVAYAIGMVVSGTILLVFSVIRDDTVMSDVIRKIALQAVPVSLGASIAASQFEANHAEAEHRVERPLLFPSVGIGIAGAMILGFTVGATEEPMIIGEQLTWLHATGLVIISIAVALGVSYAVGRRRLGIDPFDRKWFGFYLRESLVTYIVAILIAAYMLWTFGRIDVDTGAAPAVHMILVLGVVTVLGATAAELLVS